MTAGGARSAAGGGWELISCSQQPQSFTKHSPIMPRLKLALFLALLSGLCAAGHRPACPPSPASVQLPNATASGYLRISDQGNRLFYLYYEADAEDAKRDDNSVPITLWLQGGPGCASLFGAFYELGPELVDGDLNLQPNPGSWSRHTALLFIDQPLGAGFSVPGEGQGIPQDEMTLAADLYAGLQAFFLQHPQLQPRPLVIAGESYAGKYVPSIGHFILQQSVALGGARSRGRLLHATLANASATADAAANNNTGRRRSSAESSTGTGTGTAADAGGTSEGGANPESQQHQQQQSHHPRRLHHRPLPASLLRSRPLLGRPPLFELRGLAIGNGLTDPAVQVMTHADTAYYQGWLDPGQRLRAMAMQLETVQLISAGEWEAAHSMRSALLEHIRGSAGVATLLDMRRYEDYDAAKLVDCYLNLPEVKEALGADPGVRWQSCSPAVGAALSGDVMRSVKYLVPDLLAAYPLLLYQGMWDAQDGAATSEAWIYSLGWEGREGFAAASRWIVRERDVECSSDRCLCSTASSSSGSSGSGSGTGGSGGEAEGGGSGNDSSRPELHLSTPGASADAGVGAAGSHQQQRRLLRQQQPGRQQQPQDVRQQEQQHGEQAQEQRGMQQQQQPAEQPAEQQQQQVVGYWKHSSGLTHVVLTQAGHMVPRDAPRPAACMLQRWLRREVLPQHQQQARQ